MTAAAALAAAHLSVAAASVAHSLLLCAAALAATAVAVAALAAVCAFRALSQHTGYKTLLLNWGWIRDRWSRGNTVCSRRRR